MRRFLAIVVLAAMTAVPSTAHEARAAGKCHAAHAKPPYRSNTVRVFELTRAAYSPQGERFSEGSVIGCDTRSGRWRYLNQAEDGSGFLWYLCCEVVARHGATIAYSIYGDHEDGQSGLHVSVISLLSGREYASSITLLSEWDEPTGSTGGNSNDADVEILDQALSSSGRLVMILRKTVPFETVPANEPYVVISSVSGKGNGLTLLDHGPGVDVTSLRISGRNAFWTNNGQLRSRRIR